MRRFIVVTTPLLLAAGVLAAEPPNPIVPDAGDTKPPRRTLGRAFEKLKAGGDVGIACFGGIINARKAGDSLAFEFEGTALGIHQNVQKDGGKYEWTIDDGRDEPADKHYGGPRGSKHGKVDTAPDRHAPRCHYAMLSCGLKPGKHTLKIKLLEEHDATSTGNRLLIGYFMVAGAK